MTAIVSRSTLISLIVFHVFLLMGDAAMKAGESDGFQRGIDRRICSFPDPPPWCNVPDVAKGSIFEELERSGADAENIGSLPRIVGLAWGGLRLLFRMFFFDYGVLEAQGALGGIGLVLRWIGLATLVSAIVSIGVGVLTRGR